MGGEIISESGGGLPRNLHFKYEQAKKWADQLARTFSTKLATSPEIAAIALDIYLGARAAEVGRLLLVETGDPLREQIEDEMGDDDLPF
ncbi:hypothetical protein C7U62_01305 [Mesorhizobium loti]|nr:hypothetical protein C7U62_01305 [Mesorhizobium loti]